MSLLISSKQTALIIASIHIDRLLRNTAGHKRIVSLAVAGIRQLALFTAAWTHGCIGLHFWLRIRSWYAKFFPMLLTAAVLFPVLALLGVTQAGREVSVLVANWKRPCV